MYDFFCSSPEVSECGKLSCSWISVFFLSVSLVSGLSWRCQGKKNKEEVVKGRGAVTENDKKKKKKSGECEGMN